MKIAVCCITKNEEIHLERLIKNIDDLANEIIIVDSFSEDKTKDIALKYNCKFYQKSFDNFSNQKIFVLIKFLIQVNGYFFWMLMNILQKN